MWRQGFLWDGLREFKSRINFQVGILSYILPVRAYISIEPILKGSFFFPLGDQYDIFNHIIRGWFFQIRSVNVRWTIIFCVVQFSTDIKARRAKTYNYSTRFGLHPFIFNKPGTSYRAIYIKSLQDFNIWFYLLRNNIKVRRNLI